VEAVGRVEAALWRGPRGARVDEVTVDEVAPSGQATGFRVRS